MSSKAQIIVSSVLLLLTTPTLANDVVMQLLQDYRSQTTQPFAAEAGRQLWIQTFSDEKGRKRSCSTCHTDNPRQSGKHSRTGKKIEPLAPSINKESLSKTGNIQKWLKRNCKWTLGRECDAQEKGDVLTYLNSL